MPKLPRLTGAEMVQFLQSQGFAIVRIRGSHQVMQRGTLHTVVPAHGAKTLRGILRDIDMSPAEFSARSTA